MITSIVFWIVGIINVALWGLALSQDRSGAGMVMIFTMPLAFVVSLISFGIVGWML